jgi:ATP-dependent DNA helicase RecQ
VQTAQFLIESGSDNDSLTPEERADILARDRQRLAAMVDFCKTPQCLRGCLLDYFGQAHEDRCGHCGNCQGEYTLEDITVPAQKILSCVKRAQDHLGYSVGASLIIATLRGSRNKRVRELELEDLTTYGIMKDTSREDLQGMVEHLEAMGYLRTHPEYRTLVLTQKAGEVLFRGEKVTMAVKKRSPLERGRRQTTPVLEGEEAESLFAALKEVRSHLAQQAGVPAYIVFSNATLMDMAAKAPRTMADFLTVSGVGEQKAQRYGKAFLSAIQDYTAQQT